MVVELVLVPASERSPGKGMAIQLQYSCLETPMDKGAWQVIHRVTNSQTQLSNNTFTFHSRTGSCEGPNLQYFRPQTCSSITITWDLLRNANSFCPDPHQTSWIRNLATGLSNVLTNAAGDSKAVKIHVPKYIFILILTDINKLPSKRFYQYSHWKQWCLFPHILTKVCYCPSFPVLQTWWMKKKRV